MNFEKKSSIFLKAKLLQPDVVYYFHIPSISSSDFPSVSVMHFTVKASCPAANTVRIPKENHIDLSRERTRFSLNPYGIMFVEVVPVMAFIYAINIYGLIV